MTTGSLRVLVIGAHPDDAEVRAGGIAALYRQAGHEVCFVSVTNGESGHQTLHGERLAAIRREEAQAAGRVLGLEYRVLAHRDGHLEIDLAKRLEMIRLIREFRADLVFTHRPWDYHPDHRYTSQLVCDAAYMVTVPAVAPEAAYLSRNPVIMYLWDGFTRPYPFEPAVVVDIEPVVERVLDMLACHRSQVFDFLPFNRGELDQVPTDPHQQRSWLRDWWLNELVPPADKYRDQLITTYGPQRGRQVRWIEAFEWCEYGSPLTAENRFSLFPFLPVASS
jgi:N-acetylglucosamine malate deacetylase 1